MRIRFYWTHYLWFGHAKTIAGVPYNAGWTQGLGVFAVEIHWKRKR